MFRFFHHIFFAGIILGCASCDKGYEVRFTNYYTQPVDSVVLSGANVLFQNVELQQTTSFMKISKGKYPVTIISKSKEKFTTTLNIPGTGSGKRTIQVDAIKQVSILEE